MDACPISLRDFLNAHYVTIFKTSVTIFFKENLTENMSILYGHLSDFSRGFPKRSLSKQYT